ncbi:MAG: hypothetical protein U5N85_10665 [Arcicella sp.]|nr:hypothetical protein [Arcicella sp.]
MIDINAVRTQTAGDAFGVNAGLPAYTGSQTKDDLLNEVYKQRCAELFLTGLRLEDSVNAKTVSSNKFSRTVSKLLSLPRPGKTDKPKHSC